MRMLLVSLAAEIFEVRQTRAWGVAMLQLKFKCNKTLCRLCGQLCLVRSSAVAGEALIPSKVSGEVLRLVWLILPKEMELKLSFKTKTDLSADEILLLERLMD
jgi:hypothetical protein